MDDNPTSLIPAELRNAGEGNAVKIDLNHPIAEVCKELSKYPVATRVSLNGTIIVARDIAHARLKARLDKGEELPQYFKDYPVLYAGPAKTPKDCHAAVWALQRPIVWTLMLMNSRIMEVP